MNCIYFACRTCQLYIDAGYRWTQTLPDTIQRGQLVDVDVVFSSEEYWRGVEEDEELRELLQQIKAFLKIHKHHEVIFGEEEDFRHHDTQSLDWMDEEIDKGFGERNATEYFWGPRHFAEKLGYTTWEQLVEHISKLEFGNWWFEDTELRAAGQQKFAYYVRRRTEGERL